MSLNNVLKCLEDSGEVNVQVAEHQLSKDAAGNFNVKPVNSVCFVLDEQKTKKKKAKVGSGKAVFKTLSKARGLFSQTS